MHKQIHDTDIVATLNEFVCCKCNCQSGSHGNESIICIHTLVCYICCQYRQWKILRRVYSLLLLLGSVAALKWIPTMTFSGCEICLVGMKTILLQ